MAKAKLRHILCYIWAVSGSHVGAQSTWQTGQGDLGANSDAEPRALTAVDQAERDNSRCEASKGLIGPNGLVSAIHVCTCGASTLKFVL